ncbi:MAG: DNA-binding protein [Gammaproteobacteria bacterium]
MQGEPAGRADRRGARSTRRWYGCPGPVEDGDPTLVTHVLGDVARANGTSQLARDTGLGRERLYQDRDTAGW